MYFSSLKNCGEALDHYDLKLRILTINLYFYTISIRSCPHPSYSKQRHSVCLSFVDNQDKPLLEQRWPEIDRDYQLDLICKVNGQDCCVIKLPMTEFTPELLDQQRALQLFRQNESFLKYHSTRKVVRTEFDLCPGIQAMITLITEQKPKKKALSS